MENIIPGTNEANTVEQPKKKWKLVVLIIVACIAGHILLWFAAIAVTYYVQHPLFSLDGKTRYEYYATGRVKTESVYDKGRLIKQTRYDDEGMYTSTSEYQYDENGKLKTEEKFDDYEGAEFVMEYNENEQVFKESRYVSGELGSVYLYVYDDEGNKIEEEKYDESGNPISREVNEYDDQNRRIKLSHYAGSGSLEYWQSFHYDSQARYVKWRRYDASDRMIDGGGYPMLN